MKTILILAMMCVLIPSLTFAKGSVGGRSGGSFSGSKSVAPKTTAPKTTAPKTTAPSTPKVTKPSTSTTRATKSTAPKPSTVKGKQTGYVVDKNYQPKFRGGYTAPEGSTVYYRDNSFLDYWMFWSIFNSNNAHREATVVQPDGKTEVVKEEGVDTMYVINWIVAILLLIGIIAGIMFLVNYLVRRKNG